MFEINKEILPQYDERFFCCVENVVYQYSLPA
ncbi:hypothetical protein HMPREF1062_01393 [Bacteroides cellulosilyticus CL02T12C19]|uniref:Uncharacterized protein n=1 Tax=Bacteroides cellulosilyticus CL02T12C19 TaxID=997874 RepID=I8W8R9_9BACE|nr:hypothetical protein HMPREF1062_01393 [Bacteroides cellulosilyticus CL02T12C19]